MTTDEYLLGSRFSFETATEASDFIYLVFFKTTGE